MRLLGFVAVFATLLSGCSTAQYDPHVAAVENQLQARTIQTRTIEAESYQALATAVISTLQDYHFRIGDVDPDLGTITAYQLTGRGRRGTLSGRTALSVLIRQRDEGIYSVRMNMTIDRSVGDTPELYQQFFTALQRKLHYRANV